MKILFMGRKQVSASALNYLSTKKDVEVTGVITDSHLSVSPTTDMANKLGYRIFTFDEALQDINDGALEFDLGISILYWRKLTEEFINNSKYGIINFHPAPLPDYKGTAGYNVAILDGLQEWAVSAHYIDKDIDSGEIIKTRTFPIDENIETIMSIEKKSTEEIYSLFIEIVDKALNDRSKLESTPNIGGRYISRNEMESMKEIRLDEDIDKKIRAFWFPPYDGAYIEIGGKKYTLVNREILENLANPNTSSLFTKTSN